MSFSKGLKKHGEKAVAKLFKELTQLDQGAAPDKPVCVPQYPDALTDEDKKRALDAVVLLEETKWRYKSEIVCVQAWSSRILHRLRNVFLRCLIFLREQITSMSLYTIPEEVRGVDVYTKWLRSLPETKQFCIITEKCIKVSSSGFWLLS